MKLTLGQLRVLVEQLLIEEEEDKNKSQDDDQVPDELPDVSQGPTAMVAFLNSPAGQDPRVRELLKSGRKDGNKNDESAKIAETSPTVGSLVPTQREIELTKSIAYPLARFESMKGYIGGGVHQVGPTPIVTSGNLIIDGHHRWSSLFSITGPKGQIKAFDISLPETDAASVLAIVQAAIATTLGTSPVPEAKAGSSNILGKGENEIYHLLEESAGESGEAGVILSDDYVLSCINDPEVSKYFGIGAKKQAKKDKNKNLNAERRFMNGLLLFEKDKDNESSIRDAKRMIMSKVAKNLSLMEQPAPGSPPRVDMPQLDQAGGGIKGVLKKLSSGDVNYKAPFSPNDKNKKQVADGYRRNGVIIVERWQRLAGLLK